MGIPDYHTRATQSIGTAQQASAQFANVTAGTTQTLFSLTGRGVLLSGFVVGHDADADDRTNDFLVIIQDGTTILNATMDTFINTPLHDPGMTPAWIVRAGSAEQNRWVLGLVPGLTFDRTLTIQYGVVGTTITQVSGEIYWARVG